MNTLGYVLFGLALLVVCVVLVWAALYDRNRGHEVATDEERLEQPRRDGHRRWLWRH